MKTRITQSDLQMFDRIVSHWKKENNFTFWKNLSDFQRKVLTKDLISHFENVFLMGRESVLTEIIKSNAEVVQKVKFRKRRKS